MNDVCESTKGLVANLTMSKLPKLSPFLSSKAMGSDVERQLDTYAHQMLTGNPAGMREFYDSCDKRDRLFLAVARCAFMGALLNTDVQWFDEICADAVAYVGTADIPMASLAAELLDSWLRGWLNVRVGYPQWLLELDFSNLPDAWRIDAACIAVRALTVSDSFAMADCLARSLMVLPCEVQPLPEQKIALLLSSSLFNVENGNMAVSGAQYEQALKLAEENNALLPMMLGDMQLEYARNELCANSSEQFRFRLIEESNRVFESYLAFRNQLYGKTDMDKLTRRQFQIALMLRRKDSYKKIGLCMGLSIGRVRNLVMELYEKMYVHRRRQLIEKVY